MDATLQAMVTVGGIVLTGAFSTIAAIINSNARQKVTEQKFEDAIENVKADNAEIKKRLSELSETDSCCVELKEDMTEIKANLEDLAATLNQFKAKSDDFDEKLQEAFKAIAKDRISQGHRYFMNKGEITESSKESMHAIFAYYKNMGGNGYVESEMRDIDSLPVV